MQINKENKKKLISGGITVLFHLLLVLLLFVFGLPYQDPPPPEQGVEISSGDLTDVGNAMLGDAGGDEAEEQVSEPTDSDDESVVTQKRAALYLLNQTNQNKRLPKKIINQLPTTMHYSLVKTKIPKVMEMVQGVDLVMEIMVQVEEEQEQIPLEVVIHLKVEE